MVFGQGGSEFDGGELEVEGRDHLNFSADSVLACLEDVELGVNPDDTRCASQCKGSPKSPGDALTAVVVEDLQVDSTTGEAQDHENPSLQLEVPLVSKNGSNDVPLAEGERRLGGLEDVRDISLESRKAFLIKFNATRAGFLQISDHPSDAGDEELGLNVTEHLKDVSAMSKGNLCVPPAQCIWPGLFLTDEGNSNPRPEASV